MSQDYHVSVRFHAPPPPLRAYFTTYYHIDCPMPAGRVTQEYLLPEWANLRFYRGSLPSGHTMDGQKLGPCRFPVTGHSSKAIAFNVGTSQLFGIGILPLGWAKFIQAPASTYADMIVDGHIDPAFASFSQLAELLCSDGPADFDARFQAITDHFMAMIDRPCPDEARISAIHAALLDNNTMTVADIVQQTGINLRAVERLSLRTFGFTPKRLLRRQRFMRSLTSFLLNPSPRWTVAIDSHYHDQSQFVRDFRHFMGMSPRQYAALDKPLITAILKARTQLAGTPIHKLIPPGGMLAPH